MTTNNPIMVKCAKECYDKFPTIVNSLKESGVTYNNTMLEYSRMDNKFAKSRMGIGLSSNLAMLALTYYWTESNKALYDNFVILSVLAQVIIDGCKREYEVDGIQEIDRIMRLDCMKMVKDIIENDISKTIKCDLPRFMKYTKQIKFTKDGKERDYDDVKKDKTKLLGRINNNLICPMNWLEEILDKIKIIPSTNTTLTESFFIKMEGKGNHRQMSKIRKLVESYDLYVKNNIQKYDNENKEEKKLFYNNCCDKFDDMLIVIRNMKINNIITINRLIETSLQIETLYQTKNKNVNSKYTRKILNTLYKTNKCKLLSNFKEKC